jgi:hypothetical protein
MADARLAWVLAVLLAGPVAAEGWVGVEGAALRDLLEQKDVRFDNGQEQLFFLGGITRFSHGWPNEGRWKVRDGEYCSNWPPEVEWHCLAVSADGARVRFEDAEHRVWLGEIVGPAKWP